MERFDSVYLTCPYCAILKIGHDSYSTYIIITYNTNSCSTIRQIEDTQWHEDVNFIKLRVVKTILYEGMKQVG